MTLFPYLYPAVQLILAVVAGLMLGLFHFASLRWLTRHYLLASLPFVMAAWALRIMVLIAAFVLLARWGGGPLLAGAIGLLIGRWWIMRRVRKIV